MCLNLLVLLGNSLRAAVKDLTSKGVPSPRMNAELLLMFTLGCDRAYLYGHPERELTQDEVSRYQEALSRRAAGVPAQYITGHQEFWGMDLLVTPDVLIPRPETEHVIERVLGLVRSSPVPHESLPHKLRIIDVGTGSGCIALALAKELPDAEIHATDISPAALEIAKANAARHNLLERIRFHEADLLGGIERNAFDLVVSNPPYVGTAEEDQVQLEVRKFEPKLAVFAGQTGIEIISRLVPEAYWVLKPGGWLVMEISGTIVDRAKAAVLEWEQVQVLPDLQSIPRVLSARKCPEVH